MEKKKKNIVFIILCTIIAIAGISYAWFNYSQEGTSRRLITGSLYLVLEDGNDNLEWTNVYPLSPAEARSRNDNVITFSIDGKNNTNKDIYYEISIKNGDVPEPIVENENTINLVRINPKHLVFDLVEVKANNEEEYLLSAVSFESLNNQKYISFLIIDSGEYWIQNINKQKDYEIVNRVIKYNL